MSPKDDGDGDLGSYPLSLDAMLEILSNEERRYLLEYLVDHAEEDTSPKEAIRYISRQLANRRGEQPSTEDVHVALHHHHLPKLSEAGIVEYSLERDTIRYLGNDRLEELHELISEFEND